jgi:hypothetical protein
MRESATAPAVLFWFYREPELCANRLRLIRRFNPGCRIFGLYGGDADDAPEFRARLEGLLDDFYAFTAATDPWWKWVNGDLVIRTWYEERGRELPWNSIVVAQWDMLLLGSLESLVGTPGADDVILSGLRPVAEVSSWWPWVKGAGAADLETFMDHLRVRHGYSGEPWCCQFVLACFGRQFLEAYAGIEKAELGFIEYRVPTYARAFGLRVAAARFPCWWEGDPSMQGVPAWRRTLSARRAPVATRHLLRAWITDGSAVVHPYRQHFPVDARSAYAFVRRRLSDTLTRARPGSETGG